MMMRTWFATQCQLGIEPTESGRRPVCMPYVMRLPSSVSGRWYQEGVDVQALLPHLSVYLGHVREPSPESYWYLTATPELLAPPPQLGLSAMR